MRSTGEKLCIQRSPVSRNISTAACRLLVQKNPLNAANCEELCIHRISGVERNISRRNAETPVGNATHCEKVCQPPKKLDRTFSVERVKTFFNFAFSERAFQKKVLYWEVVVNIKGREVIQREEVSDEKSDKVKKSEK